MAINMHLKNWKLYYPNLVYASKEREYSFPILPSRQPSVYTSEGSAKSIILLRSKLVD